MVIIAMDAADVARTADSKDGDGVAACRPDADTVCDTSALADVTAMSTPFDWSDKLCSDVADFRSTTSDADSQHSNVITNYFCK